MLKNIIIITIIVGVVAVSQQPAVKTWGQNTFSWISKKGEPYTAKVNSFFAEKLYPAISVEVGKRKNIVDQEIKIEKEKISESLSGKIKNYFSNVIDSIFFPNKPTQTYSSLKDSLDSSDSEIKNCIQSCQLKP